MSSLATGMRLGDYELVRRVASGGMAEVYLAHDRGRYVAIKALNAQRASDAESRALFMDLGADVHALGVVLYELTTGRRCFHGQSDFERMLAAVRGTYVPPSVHVRDYPPALEQVIRTALAVDPSHRYASGAALIAALEDVARSEGWSLGVATTGRMMQTLFGDTVSPWQTELDDATYVCSPRDLPAFDAYAEVATRARLARVVTPQRFARGALNDIGDPDVSDWHDEAPTRVRRSVSRVRGSRLAA